MESMRVLESVFSFILLHLTVGNNSFGRHWSDNIPHVLVGYELALPENIWVLADF